MDVWAMLINALWILGLAVILAVWSYARYTAHVKGVRVKEKFDTLKYALVLNAGVLLFLLGMMLTEDRWWVRILWTLLIIWVLVDSALRLQQHKAEKKKLHGQD
jgi:cell division protein FtsW (lipid II flippase)